MRAFLRPALVALLTLVALVSFPAPEARADALATAEHAITHGRYEAALKVLLPLVREAEPRALALSGRIHTLRGEREAAEQRYRDVIALSNRGAIDERDGTALWAVA